VNHIARMNPGLKGTRTPTHQKSPASCDLCYTGAGSRGVTAERGSAVAGGGGGRGGILGGGGAGLCLPGGPGPGPGRVFLNFFIWLIIGFLVMEVLLWAVGGRPALSNYQPSLVIHVASVLLGLALGYAAALTVIVGEAIRLLITTVQDVEKGVEGEMAGAGHVLQAVEQAVRGKR